MISSQLKRQVNDVIKYSQSHLPFGPEGPHTDELLERWAQSKEQLYHLLGDKLIYETGETISFELGEDARRRNISNFRDWLIGHFHYYDLSDFIGYEAEGFFSNTVVRPFKYGGETIPEGMKLLKAFKYFIDDEDALRMVQDKASEFVQMNKLSGKLCISIHPLDYLSSSETNHNWRSCHALDGEYRGGCISYMCDTTTVVCYIRSDKDTILPHFPETVPWNDKKWRMLLHMNEKGQNVLLAGRQYPFPLDGAREKISDIIAEMRRRYYRYDLRYTRHNYADWTDEHICSLRSNDLNDPDQVYHLQKSYRLINGLITPITTFVKTPKFALHYNDATCSHIYPYPHITWDVDSHFNVVPKINIGGEDIKCLCCGENLITSHGTFACDICENQSDECWYCDYCDASIPEGEQYYVEGYDVTLCRRCYEHNFEPCPLCGDITATDDLRYSEDTHSICCSSCRSRVSGENVTTSTISLGPGEITMSRADTGEVLGTFNSLPSLEGLEAYTTTDASPPWQPIVRPVSEEIESYLNENMREGETIDEMVSRIAEQWTNIPLYQGFRF